MPRKKLKLTRAKVWKKAFKQAEESWKDAAKRRDGYVCKMCAGDMVLQVDHGIVKRGHKATFFDIRNSLTLCQSCHTRKTHKIYGADAMVHALIETREGAGITWKLAEASRPIKKWSVAELIDVKTELDKMFTDTPIGEGLAKGEG